MDAMANKIQTIKSDLDELNNFLEASTRTRTKNLLTTEIKKLQQEMIDLTNPSLKAPKPTMKFEPKLGYDVKLTNYAWDQSKESVKIYVTLKGVKNVANDSVSCHFTERSMNLQVNNLDLKNYYLHINNLCEDIDPSKSSFKIKTDMVVVTMIKKNKKDWAAVTSVEKSIKDAKDFKKKNDYDSSDPSAGLMSIMSKMYQEGDDEMKRTIAKAWSESQEKKMKGEKMEM
ncbi:hypothetical protein TKK_0017949 [Trichogramma kaykai]|uniref:Calcyclin-binding protein n=1 Tax=Trichogramma kaykai TaxID=54128 RepID=A0ABD2W0H2_9HYME